MKRIKKVLIGAGLFALVAVMTYLLIIRPEGPGRADIATTNRARHVVAGHVDIVVAKRRKKVLPMGHDSDYR